MRCKCRCFDLEAGRSRCDVDASILKLAVNVAAKAARSGLTTKRRTLLGTKMNKGHYYQEDTKAPGLTTTRTKDVTNSCQLFFIYVFYYHG